MTAKVTPTRRPSHGLPRNLAGIAACLFLLGALGACAGHKVPTPPPESAAPEITEAPATAAPSTTVFELSGTGEKTSDPFSAIGDSVDVAWSYKCPEDASFTVNFYGTNASPELPDVLVDEFGSARSDTTTELLNGATGPFHIEVVTTCEWSVKVLGTR